MARRCQLGLTRSQRQVVGGMVANEINGEEVRSTIRKMVTENDARGIRPIAQENIQFCGALSASDYPETAKLLSDFVDGRKARPWD